MPKRVVFRAPNGVAPLTNLQSRQDIACQLCGIRAWAILSDVHAQRIVAKPWSRSSDRQAGNVLVPFPALR